MSLARSPADIKEESDEKPSASQCPIYHVRFKDPVVAPDDHTYERKAVETWLQRCPAGKFKSPLTGKVVDNRPLISNHALRNVIQEQEQAKAKHEDELRKLAHVFKQKLHADAELLEKQKREIKTLKDFLEIQTEKTQQCFKIINKLVTESAADRVRERKQQEVKPIRNQEKLNSDLLESVIGVCPGKLKQALAEGADANACTQSGKNPYILAVKAYKKYEGNPIRLGRICEILKILKTYNANVNAVDQLGNSAMHYAAELKDQRCAGILKFAGASSRLKNHNGETPDSICEKNSYLRRYSLFRKKNISSSSMRRSASYLR